MSQWRQYRYLVASVQAGSELVVLFELLGLRTMFGIQVCESL